MSVIHSEPVGPSFTYTNSMTQDRDWPWQKDHNMTRGWDFQPFDISPAFMKGRGVEIAFSDMANDSITCAYFMKPH